MEGSGEIEENKLKQFIYLINEIDNDKSYRDILILIRNYNSQNWSDWLEDIMNYGVAFPISEISSDGDVIVDLVDFLRSNKISTHQYEDAIASIIDQFAFLNPNPIFLERLINALISLRGQKTNTTLLKILTSRDNNHMLGKFDNIKSIALLALARSSGIENSIKQSAYNYIRMVGLKELKHDPSFYGNALRFSYLQISVESFFKDLSIIIRKLNDDNPYFEKLVERYVSVIVDKLQEVHFRKISFFYSSFCKWYIKSVLPLNENRLFILISKKITFLINGKPYLDELYKYGSDLSELISYKKDEFIETEYGKCLRFVMNLTQETLNINFSCQDIIKASAFLFEREKESYLAVLPNIIKKHRAYISNFYGFLPYLVEGELASNYNDEVIQAVVDLYDDIIFSPDDSKGNDKNILEKNDTESHLSVTLMNEILAKNTKNFLTLLAEKEHSVYEALERQCCGAY